MQEKFEVLDHGYVRLVEHMGNDMSIVRAARVSYDAEPRQDGSDMKLLNYLLKNKHTSPFEMVEFTFEVKAPIFIFRQWHRHRTWSFNEVSARYTELPEEFYVPTLDTVGVQAKHNKQMRDMECLNTPEHTNALLARMEMHNRSAFNLYRDLLAGEIPRELARSVLPVATYSHMFAKIDLHNLFHFLELRLHEHAQYEIRVYAEAMLEIITPIVPIACAAFRKFVLNIDEKT